MGGEGSGGRDRDGSPADPHKLPRECRQRKHRVRTPGRNLCRGAPVEAPGRAGP